MMLSKLIIDIYKVSEQEIFNVLASPNGVFISGINSSKEDIRIDISDISFYLKNKSQNQSGEPFYKLNYDSYYVEQPFDIDTVYKSKQEELFDYGEFMIQAGRYFKIWFFSKEQQCPDLRKYAHDIYVSFSVRSSQNFQINFGVSNTTTYKQISKNIELKDENEWNKYEFSLIDNFSIDDENGYIASVVNYVRLNFNRPITRKGIAEYVHLHPSYLSKLFKQNMGVTIGEYINSVRITNAKRLLRETELTMEVIAESVGFYDNHHLQKVFKKAVGCSPGRYRSQAGWDD